MDARVVLILAVLGIAQCKIINTCSDAKRFVDGHNARRLQLAKGQVSRQPAASQMKYMVWDDELAAKAYTYASKQIFDHNPDKTIPSGRFTVGENLYWYATDDKNFKFDPEMAMKSWWDEHLDYTYGRLTQNTFRGPKKVGHYTQMAWEKSSRIGCAISQYYEGGWNNFLVVCNYGPGGNYLNEFPYQTGGTRNDLICDISCNFPYGNACSA